MRNVSVLLFGLLASTLIEGNIASPARSSGREQSILTHALHAAEDNTPLHHATELVERDARHSTHPLPDSMQVQFSLGDDVVTLNLKRQAAVSSEVPVLLGTEEGIQRFQPEEEHAFGVYHDDDNVASISVTSHIGASGREERMYSGIFRSRNEDFILRPAVAEHARSKRDIARDITDATYYIYRTQRELMSYEGDALDRMNTTAFLRENAKRSYQPDVREFNNYGVESLLVLDYAAYKRWSDMSQKINPSAGQTDIINNMKYFYTHVYSGIDQRYKTIKHSRMAVYVRLSAFYIATSSSMSQFTERHVLYEPNFVYGLTEAYDSLDDLEAWLKKEKANLPHHDQATLFTGYHLQTGRNSDGSLRQIQGLADIRGVCTDLSAAICANWGLYQAIQTAAHEMGHNLGAIHDGSSKNNCPSGDQYIMAISPGNLDDRNYNNVFKFSYCSIDAIAANMDDMNMANKNCLKDAASWYDQGAVDSAMRKPTGQFMDWDKQCQYAKGMQSFYCAGEDNDAKMCESLTCYDPNTKQCVTSVEMRASDGTTCGNNKWCQKGKCVYDSSAPRTSDKCISGDYKGEFMYNPGKTCKTVASSTKGDCYQDQYLKACCATCNDIKDTSIPDCPYGDRNAEYCRTGIRSGDCYQSSTQKDCCGTCAANKKNTPGCEYGDRSSHCSANDLKRCYNDFAQCCETCTKHKDSGIPGCEWGDKASWCATMKRGECYRSGEMCCKRCAQFKTGISGCEYGDKIEDCYNRDCNDSYYKNNCCYTCRGRQELPAKSAGSEATAIPLEENSAIPQDMS